MSCNLSVRASSEHPSRLYWMFGVGRPGHCICKRHFTCFLHLLIEGQVRARQPSWIPLHWLHGAQSRILPTLLNPSVYTPFPFCLQLQSVFLFFTPVWGKHNYLAVWPSFVYHRQSTDPQLWVAQGLSKAIQLSLSRLMLSFINKVQSHQLQCCKCLTNRNGDKHMLKSIAKLVSQRGRGLRLMFIDCMWF